jgi:hypothetical protein
METAEPPHSMNCRVVELLLEGGSSPYADWFATLDPVAAAKVKGK